MAERIWRRQNDDGAARPPDPPLRHRRDRQRELALQEPRLIRQPPTCPSLASCSPPSRTLRAASGGGLWPSLTATVRGALGRSGRDEETAPVSRTKKHHWLHPIRNERGPFWTPIGVPVCVPIDTV